MSSITKSVTLSLGCYQALQGLLKSEMTTCGLLEFLQTGNGGVRILKPQRVFLTFCLVLSNIRVKPLLPYLQVNKNPPFQALLLWMCLLSGGCVASYERWKKFSSLQMLGSSLNKCSSVPGGMTVAGNGVPVFRGIFCFA